MKTRTEALELMRSWVSSDSLRRHCLSVAYAMEGYARKFLNEGKLEGESEEVDKWWICGLLHDMDWERHPDINLHPIEGCKRLRELEYDEEIIEAILGHNSATGIPRRGLMAKTLFAVDELSGLIVALAKVREGNFIGMTWESVEKAMKKKDFAKNINREDIEKGIFELALDRKEHFESVISTLNSVKKEIGF